MRVETVKLRRNKPAMFQMGIKIRKEIRKYLKTDVRNDSPQFELPCPYYIQRIIFSF